MRVTLVSSYYAPVLGGIETHVAQLARKLSERGATVNVVCLARWPDHASVGPGDDVLDGIAIRRVDSRGLGESVRWPAQLVQAGSCDVVHFHGFSRALLLRLTYDARAIPWIITPHGGVHGAFTDPLQLRRLAKAAFDGSLGRWLLRRASRVVALTEIEAQYLTAVLGVEPTHVAIVPNALGGECFEFAAGTQGSSNRLLTLSRLEPIKRIGDLIFALRLIPDPPGCDIVGPDHGELTRLVNLSRGIRPGTVRFHEPIFGAAKRALLRAAKALILPSLLETFSITALEAIAQGTPVIASEAAAAGLPAAGVITFPGGDVRALAERIRSLEDPAVLETLRLRTLAARSNIMTADQQTDRIWSLYTDVRHGSGLQPVGFN